MYVALHGVTWCMLYGVHRTFAETAAVSCGTSHASAVSTPLWWIFFFKCYKKLVTHVEPHASAVSLLKRAENSAVQVIINQKTNKKTTTFPPILCHTTVIIPLHSTVIISHHTTVIIPHHTAVIIHHHTTVIIHHHTAVIIPIHTAVTIHHHTAVIIHLHTAGISHHHTAVIIPRHTAVIIPCSEY